MISNYFFLWNPGDVVTGSDAQVSVPAQTLTDLPGTVTMAMQYLFACSTIIASSQTPFSFLPTFHSCCLSVHSIVQPLSGTVVKNKSPLSCHIVLMLMPNPVKLWVFYRVCTSFFPCQNMVTLDFVIILPPYFIWQLTLRCSFSCA